MKKQMKLNRILLAMIWIALCMFAVLLGRILGGNDAQVMNTRDGGNYRVISAVSYKETKSETAPLGIVKTYCFPLGELKNGTTHLAFHTIHQYVDVYLGEEHVYSLYPNPKSSIKTTGSNWAILGLYPEDAGKEVTVHLTPVYEAYQDFAVEFIVGDGLALYTDILAKDLPQLIVCGLSIVCGLFLTVFGIVWHLRKQKSGTMVSLGISAVCIGLWRLFDTNFSPLMSVKHPVFLFTASIAMLMLSIIPLVITLQSTTTKPFQKIYSVFFSVASITLLLQMLLQVFGVLDLRDTLFATHLLILTGAVLVIANKCYKTRITSPEEKKLGMEIVAGLFVIGALIDLTVYYVIGSSSNLMFTLITFDAYVIYSGIDSVVQYNRTKKALVEKENQLINVRITMMFSQIRSHFIFNILNAISGMCKYDPEKADETIIHFARYLRTNIETIYVDELIPFRDSLRQLEDYVELEQIRFQDKIRFETDIAVDDFLIPPLMLQPIVENAIRHGLTPKHNGGTILLKTYMSGDQVCIAVRDDGVGFHPDALNNIESTALKNVRFRLQHMIGGTMDIESRVGEGTTVTMTIPRKEAES